MVHPRKQRLGKVKGIRVYTYNILKQIHFAGISNRPPPLELDLQVFTSGLNNVLSVYIICGGVERRAQNVSIWTLMESPQACTRIRPRSLPSVSPRFKFVFIHLFIHVLSMYSYIFKLEYYALFCVSV